MEEIINDTNESVVEPEVQQPIVKTKVVKPPPPPPPAPLSFRVKPGCSNA